MKERINMSKVRKSLGACLDASLLSDGQAEPYYRAAVHYLQSALERLHSQDQRIIDLLDPVVPKSDEADRQILASFDRGLSPQPSRPGPPCFSLGELSDCRARGPGAVRTGGASILRSLC